MAARRQRAGVPGWPLRVYVDTSVFGGVHDDEFRAPSERFFTAVRSGAFTVLVSEALVVEISSAPEAVRATFEAHRGHMEALETTAEAASLAEAYLAAKVVPAASRVDALHVALASVAGGPTPSSAGTSSTWSSCAASAASTRSTCCAVTL